MGHVEWVEFADVDRVPASGEIAHAGRPWAVAGGGGAVAAVQLANLAGGAALFTVLGDDDLGRRALREIEALGVTVRAAFEGPQRRALTLVEPNGERTITTLGEKLRPRRDQALPWRDLADCDGVYFVSGDVEALRAARAADVLTATTREMPTLAAAGVRLDAVIGSGRDPGERYVEGAIEPLPRVVVSTAGASGGTWTAADGRSGGWQATTPPGPAVDAYGCGDSFAAGVTFGLAAGRDVEGAVALGAACGAACLTGRGPYEAQLRSSP